MNEQTVRDIIATYAKHGWTLRRVLLSAASLIAVKDSKGGLFADAAIVASDVDAAWFSRERTDGGTAWEIRYLGPTQYALVTVIDDGAPEDDELARLESDLSEALARQPTNH